MAFSTKTNLRATAYGHTSNAYGSLNSQIHLTNEEGSNLQIRSTSTTRGRDPAFGLSSSTVETSDGNDTISIKAKSQNDRAGNGTISLESTGLKNSFLNTGGGDDTIKINAENQYNHYYGHYLESSNTLGLSGGSINSGTGDDQITITAKGGLINNAISSSSIQLAEGNDSFALTGKFTSSTFDGGSGYDSLHLLGENSNSFSWSKSGSNYWLSGNRSNAWLKNFEEVHFSDRTVVLNSAPTGPGQKNLSNGTEDTIYVIREADLLRGWSDPDGDQLSVLNLTSNNGGELHNNLNGTWSYSPAQNYHGHVNFTYQVSDGKTTSSGSAGFTLDAVNDGPVLTGSTTVLANGQEDTSQIIRESELLKGFTDVDGDRLTTQNVRYQATASNGKLLQGQLKKDWSGNWVLDPPANFAGRLNLSYEVRDGNGGIAYGTNSLNLTALNDGAGTFQISGRPAIGRTLSVGKVAPDPDGDDNSHYSYQWQNSTDGGQSWQNIQNATSANYTFTENDQKKQIRALINYTDSQGFSEQSATAGVKLPGVTVIGNDFTTGEEDGFNLDGNRNGIQPNIASFVYRLDAAPTYDVVINLAVSDASEAELSTNRLVFTSQNWNIGQTVVVRGKDDYDNDGDIAYNIIQKIETRDFDYNRLDLANLNLVNIDDSEDKPLYLYPPHHEWIVRGRNGNDRIYGGYGQQELRGYQGDDRLYGEQDDDVLIGGGGNDLLDGGNDDDTAVYSGRQDDYIVNRDSNGDYTVRDLRSNGTDGVDTLKNIERLRFSDREVAIEDLITSNYSIRSSLTSANEENASQQQFKPAMLKPQLPCTGRSVEQALTPQIFQRVHYLDQG